MSSKVKRLNESQRLEVISKLNQPNPPSKRSIARQYEVSETAIRKIWLNRENIRKRSALMSEETKKKKLRASVGRFTELEDKLYLWIDSMRRASLPVPPSLAILKAKKIAEELLIPQDAFKASWQWFSRFRERRGLQRILLHGEGAEVDRENPDLLEALDKLYAIISKYNPENVYNMDETGLFFRLLPKYTLLMPFEDVGSTRGKKRAKERVSLVVCANATGTHKIPCTLIGKPKFPACIRNREWPVKYFNQNKAWMDVATCWKWFEEVFYPQVRKKTGRPVLLLMDNAPGHFAAFEKNNIKVVFFPPNCSSWKQPCDMGIIAALKKRYKYLYLKDVLNFYELDENLKALKKEQAKRLPRGAAGVAYGNPAHLLDAAHYIKLAWDAISDVTIKNAFNKAELLTLQEGADEEVDIMGELLRSFKILNIPIDESTIDEFVHVDDENSEEFSHEILVDVNDVLERMQTTNDNEDESDHTMVEACVQSPELTESDITFGGFENMYIKVLEVEDQLLCPDVQAQAENDYNDLKNSFDLFQQKLRQVVLKAKRKRERNMHQLTIHDLFKS